jgi:hypothetical protein
MAFDPLCAIRGKLHASLDSGYAQICLSISLILIGIIIVVADFRGFLIAGQVTAPYRLKELRRPSFIRTKFKEEKKYWVASELLYSPRGR